MSPVMTLRIMTDMTDRANPLFQLAVSLGVVVVVGMPSLDLSSGYRIEIDYSNGPVGAAP